VAAPDDAAEQWAIGDFRGGKPSLYGLDRLDPAATRHGDFLPLAFLVPLAAADGHPVAVHGSEQIGHLQRAQLGASARRGEAEGDQRAVPQADHSGWALVQHLLYQIVGRRGFAGRGGANRASDAT
jgi:hypothetical protein